MIMIARNSLFGRSNRIPAAVVVFGVVALAGAFAPLRGDSIPDEAGFMPIEPISFSFQYGSVFHRLELRSSEARVFYSFLAADRDPERKPLFVFFNGGPGSATSSGLMSMGTGRYTLDNRVDGGGDVYVANPSSWTRMGNLLYVDARETGFSYNLMDRVEDLATRWREFNAQNYNTLFDAADVIRVVLRTLSARPELRANPVILVGESYGGDRASAMLHLLLNYADYGNGREMFQDPALSREIQDHFDAVFPEYRGRIVPPGTIVRQFGHQVLIQPSVPWGPREVLTEEMLRRPGSVVRQIAAETGVPYDPAAYPDALSYVEAAGRDPYIYVKPAGWLNAFFSRASVLLRTVSNLILLTGTDVRGITSFYASSRYRAYRAADLSQWTDAPVPGVSISPLVRALFLDPALHEAERKAEEPGDMTQAFGPLRPWDRYHLVLNGNANWAYHVFNVAMQRGYAVNARDARYGRMFLQNLLDVETFVTAAAFDLVCYSGAFAPSLAWYSGEVASAEVVRDASGGEPRPGRVVVTYRRGAFPGRPDPGTRTIRYPPYDRSAHAVSFTQPAELFEDVADWLRRRGIVRD